MQRLRRFTIRAARALLNLLLLALALVILWQSARLVFRSDRLDEMRRGDQLFAAGRYHEALDVYHTLAWRELRYAPAWARLGMVLTIRGQNGPAARTLAYALGQGLTGVDHDLARLYQGRTALAQGHPDEAAGFWRTVPPDSSLYPIRRTLESESRLRAADYAGAEDGFLAALTPGLPLEWRTFAFARLATLRAASDPEGTLRLIEAQADDRVSVVSDNQVGAGRWSVFPSPSLTAGGGRWSVVGGHPGESCPLCTSRYAALAHPLIPSNGPSIGGLTAVLAAPPEQRPQLLGQLYLDAGLYQLAEAQFSRVAPQSPGGLAAATFAAYTRWRAGDRAEGVRQLEAIVAAHPNDPRARAVLALTYLAGDAQEAARRQLDSVRPAVAGSADIHLAWGQWYAARRDYPAAVGAYRRALRDAPPDQRGPYLLAMAEFYLGTGLDLCTEGRPAAELGALTLPRNPRALVLLATARLRCGDPPGARDVAQQALALDPANAEAAYYLGRALALLGDRQGARSALIAAADLAPASDWRARAETQLELMGIGDG